MKTSLLALALLGAFASELSAQAQNGYAPSPSTNEVWVVDSTTYATVPPTAAAPNPIVVPAGSQPTHILGVPARHRVYVSNANGSVSIIDSIPRTLVNTVGPLTAGDFFAGMALSQDGNFLLIAGKNNANSEAGVFRLNLNTDVLSYLGGYVTANGVPLDCDVVPASVVGGSGNGIGRIFFSVPGDNQIGVIDAAGTSRPPIPAPGGAFQVTGPSQMERSPDSTFILVGGTSGNTSARRVIRIVPNSAGETTDVIEFVGQGKTFCAVDDVVFRSATSGPPFTAYAVGRDALSNFVNEMTVDPTNFAPVGVETTLNTFWANEATFDPVTNRLIIAPISNNDFAVLDLSSGIPPYSGFSRFAGSAVTPQQIAFMASTGPAVDYVTPSAGLASVPPQILIEGSGFAPGAVAQLVDGQGISVDASSTTVVNSGKILATFPPATLVVSSIYSVRVVNPDTQESTLNGYFQSLIDTAPAPVPPFPVALPSLSNGYAMVSFPQFSSVGDLKSALAAQVGPYNSSLYRLFLWDRTQYVEINRVNLAEPSDIMGKGLFALSRLGTSVTLPSPDVATNSTGGSRLVSLTPGWNLISYPFIAGSVGAFGSVQVSRFRDLSYSTYAPTSGLVHANLYEFVGNQYFATSNMIPGQAYWILNLTSGPLYLEFQSTTGKRVQRPIPAFAAAAVTPPGPPSEKLGENMGCGFLGLDGILLGLAASCFRRRLRRRTLGA